MPFPMYFSSRIQKNKKDKLFRVLAIEIPICLLHHKSIDLVSILFHNIVAKKGL